jgi:hypothetical protein
MKNFICLFVLLLIFKTAAAPNRAALYIIAPPVFNYYDSLCRAVGEVESGGDTLAYNPQEQAAGYFQVRPIRLLDYAQRTGIQYTLTDMMDYHRAREVFMYYARDKTWEAAAKSWNGSGAQTVIYWHKVQLQLHNF